MCCLRHILYTPTLYSFTSNVCSKVKVLRKLMQDLLKVPFLFLLEMNLNSNSDYQYQECKGGQQCETQQAVIQACFLSLSHSHIASSIKILCQPKDNHIIPSLPLSGASMKTQGCNVICSSTTLIRSCPVNCISCNIPFMQ